MRRGTACLAVLAAAALAAAIPPARAAATGAAAERGAAGRAGAAAHPVSPGATRDVIRLHVGVPNAVYIGQPLSDFMTRFPKAQSAPFAGQKNVVRVQVVGEGISALAMGDTPKSMTLESIGFNFEGRYEGVEAGTRRTVEGIGAGSTVNDLLGIYGRAEQILSEGRSAAPGSRGGAPPVDPNAPTRYVYKSKDGTVTSYFVAQGAAVVRLAMTRSASAGRYLLKRPPAPDPNQPPAAPGTPSAPPPGTRSAPPAPSRGGSRAPA